MARKRRGRGEGSVYQRKDGVWIASLSLGYDADGKRQRLVAGGQTKGEALAKLDEIKNRANQGLLTDAGNLTVAQFLQQWIDDIQATVSRGTLTGYQQHVHNLIAPRIGAVRLAKLNALHVQGMYQALAQGGYSTAMQRKAGISLRAAVSWAVRMGLVQDNAVKRVKMPAHSRQEVKGLEPDQVAAFLKAAKEDRLYAIYVLALDSGCRQGELLGLLWGDINFERGTVTITRALEEVGGELALKEPKTARSRRTIALSAFTLAALQEHRKAMLAEGSYGPDRPVFCGVRNRSWLRKSDIYRHSFAPLLQRAGLKFRFHDMRHACASFLLMAGTDIKTVQERLGHSTAVMTLTTYSHVLEGAQAQAAEKLGAILAHASGASQVG
jgi:integrase